MISRLLLLLATSLAILQAQSTSSGTVQGTVKDPSGAPVPGALITIVNLLTNFKVTSKTGAAGEYKLNNLPPNTYHLELTQQGFAPLSRDLIVRNQVPQTIDFKLQLAGQQTEVEVHGFGDDVLENVPYAHTDADSATLRHLPIHSPGSGLSDAITYSTPGVVADSDGFFHPLGDHAQVGFSIDGQPVTDQQSKRFSTQLPVNAIRSMELITGAPNAEYGDKSSLVVNTVTKSGLGVDRPTGQIWLGYGSFGTPSIESSVAIGGKKWGNFLVANAERSGRFLDTPEFRPAHAIGNTQTFFDRFDLQPRESDSLHLNLMYSRNWFQIPNPFETPNADQRQLTRTFNIAPSYQRIISPTTLLSVNAFFRRDAIDYFPSRNVFADDPVSASQSRTLSNSGFRTDLSHVKGRFDFKTGIQYTHTALREDFSFGITNPDSFEGGVPDSLLPYVLGTPGGTPFRFHAQSGINQFAWYAQNSLTLGNLIVNTSLRIDYYAGLVTKTGVQPRAGFSYKIKRTATVIRGSYSRTMETPYNENLLLSSSTGSGGLAANVFFGFGSKPLNPGGRNQYNAGIQQALGKYFILDADYFWKYTRNAFDFGVLYNTPITFPISWRKSNIVGISGRVSSREWHGLQGSTTVGSTRARFFPPSAGGLLFQNPIEDDGVFRIDHDQKFQQTTNLRYQHKSGPWLAFTWRFDSGLVNGISSCEDAEALSDHTKKTIGFYGNDNGCGAALITIPAPGTENADHNPGRMKSRNLYNIGIGHDNLLHADRHKIGIRFNVINLTNKVALYNFQSTFGGTHYVTPRAFSASLGYSF
ncbi:TonB-dependent receptor [Bryobacter aggregatus]|uniref:TonB-dependent receptor n=1 Tax=Bryobacter aggregatus TaxID=360054 RepID=UPI0009B5C4A0|nr:TonB-dependent receptor [Bryobacter aggregatus]